MNLTFVFLSMIFCHVIADYNLQGILASMKQKKWWRDQGLFTYGNKYRRDYIAALIMHSISWSFMIMLPIAMYSNFYVDTLFVIILVFNIAFHAFIDDLKANKNRINLCVDQLLHMVQIALTAGIYDVLERMS